MFISYAQNFEDVMLWRALKHVEKGFYIDYIDCLAERREGKIKGAGLIVLALASEITKELARQFKLGFDCRSRDINGRDRGTHHESAGD